MNTMQHWGLKALALVATLTAAGTLSPAAEAGGWDRHHREPRQYYQDYGSYAPGYWYNDHRDGYRRGWDGRYAADPYGAGWRWCPETRRYVPGYGRWQRDRYRDHHGYDDGYGYRGHERRDWRRDRHRHHRDRRYQRHW